MMRNIDGESVVAHLMQVITGNYYMVLSAKLFMTDKSRIINAAVGKYDDIYFDGHTEEMAKAYQHSFQPC